jgi:hypothetical protein
MSRVGNNEPYIKPSFPQEDVKPTSTPSVRTDDATEEEVEIETETREDVAQPQSINYEATARFTQVAREVEDRLADELETTYGSIAVETTRFGIGMLDGVPAIVEISEHLEGQLHSIAVGAALVDGLLSGVAYHALTMQIQEKRRELEELKGDPNTPAAKIESLRGEIRALHGERNHLVIEVGGSVVSVALASAQKGFQALSTVVNPTTAKAGLALAGKIAAPAASVANVAISVAAVVENVTLASRISTERDTLIEEIPDTGIKRDLHDLRVRGLDKHLEENRVGIVKNTLALCSGIFGLAVASHGLAIALGITIGVVVGAAVAAAGIASAVLGGIGLAIGLGYLIYKNRDAIQHAFQKAYIAIRGQLQQFHVNQQKTMLQKVEGEIGHVESRPKRYEAELENISKRIQEDETELTAYQNMQESNLFKRIGNFVHILVLDVDLFLLKRKQHEFEQKSQALDLTPLKQITARIILQAKKAKLEAKVDKLALKVLKTIAMREQLMEVYKFGQHVASFGRGIESQPMTIERLQALRDQVMQTPIDEIREIIGADESVGEEELWDAVIEWATKGKSWV